MKTIFFLVVIAVWAHYFTENFIQFWGNFFAITENIVGGIIDVYLAKRG
jgi:hypothetical protein